MKINDVKVEKTIGPGAPVEISHLEVVVGHSFDEAFKRFRQVVQADGVLALYKEKMSYEKPSEKKRRKRREAIQRQLLQDLREQQILSGEWEKRQKKKEQKRQAKIEARKKQQENGNPQQNI